MKKLLLLIVLSALCFISNAQITDLAWSFRASGKITASPMAHEGVIYIGNSDGNFYAINASDGSKKWSFKTKHAIKSKALATDELVFFESGNIFYALDQSTGKQLWSFDTGDTQYYDQIDIYDDTRSRAAFYNGAIYVGTSDGFIYGLNKRNGREVFKVNSDANSPVRSSPFIKDDKLYFGDWNGLVYCYNLSNKKLIWKKRTYTFPKPYDTFGGITSAFTVYNNKLFFGARNPIFNVLNTESGDLEWSYTSSEGGWMYSSPVYYDSTIFIGGSDNHSLFAFDPIYGSIKWKYNSSQNIMAEPLVSGSIITFTSGDVYKPNSPGAITRLDRNSGKLISKIQLPKLSISAPIMVDNKVIFGCHDGQVYAIKFSNYDE